MQFEDYIPDALEMVSTWDIPDHEFAQVVNDQAKLMAWIDLWERWEDHSEIH